MSHQLTAEQQRMIEENRKKALERRAQKLGQAVNSNKQTSSGFSSTTVQVQPPKQSSNSHSATLAHHRETHPATSAPKRFVTPLKTDSHSPQDQNQGPKHHQSAPYNTASSRQVRFIMLLFSSFVGWRQNELITFLKNQFSKFSLLFL